MTPNCYACQYRRNLSGDAHSACWHPSNEMLLRDPLSQVMSILMSARNMDIGEVPSGLYIEGDPHGIRNGWFNWPFNFDPVWLRHCGGFKEKPDESLGN